MNSLFCVCVSLSFADMYTGTTENYLDMREKIAYACLINLVWVGCLFVGGVVCNG